MSGPSLAPRLLFIEWAGATWLDLAPRLRAGQLPQLAQLARRGRVHPLLETAPAAWPFPGAFDAWPLAAVSGWTAPAPADLVNAADLDPVLLQFFPDAESVRAPLLAALAALYTAHNSASIRLAALPAVPLHAVRLTLLADLRTVYARSAQLPVALAAGYRLLDQLLADLGHQAGPAVALALCAPGDKQHRGCAILPRPQPPDSLATASAAPLDPAALPAALAALLAPSASLSRTPSDVAPPAPPPPTSVDPDLRSPNSDQRPIRPGRPGDLARLTTLFPRVAWPADAAYSLLAFGPGENESSLLGATAWTPDGRLALAFAPDFAARPAAAELLRTTVATARREGLDLLFTTSPVPAGDPTASALLAAGFTVTGEVSLWHAAVATMHAQIAPLATYANPAFSLRPVTHDDLRWWQARPETARLLHADTPFDADLSWLALRDGAPAGLLLAHRLEAVAVIDLLVTTADAGAAGALIPLSLHALAAGRAAGLTDAIFTIDNARREAALLARRCGARLLERGLRLECRLR